LPAKPVLAYLLEGFVYEDAATEASYFNPVYVSLDLSRKWLD
jgi:hypothetical protein